MARTIYTYLRLLRVHQWVKNFFIFAPIFFSFNFFNTEALLSAFYAFTGFSLIASSIYIINDWKDMELDRQHPTKKNRPLAAKTISVKSAFIACLLLIVSGFSIYLFVLKDYAASSLLAFYFVLNICYCFKLKQLAIIDITIVAIGFVIRLFIGSIATGIELSHWIIILTFLLALLLVLGKRRNDVIIYSETGQELRKSISGYNLEFLNTMIITIVTIIIFSYIMYTISPEVVNRNGEYLYITSLFVILGLFRYLQAIFVEKKGDSPTNLVLKDRFLQITIVCWVISFVSMWLLNK
ncbi:4-hydroxybenzoate polyprenyltransferase [Dysgonomonas alginatilytica]|uniref:4-hydroxybenzoate polyprenyltransferase n=1 Tax=Dysgonomonas alginatilytica TaxID=1605892 RepID=A0A2V3PSE8_9BACT|nr:decaprenyl-phosphate phosphoribosyltransferase [Dysgonomonas alginatilytica]PXV67525.1 4-hydroxybenzoate polyprenyltransferase [Dysgonomonas alginatilytica]